MQSFSVTMYGGLAFLFILHLSWAANEKCYSADPDCLDSKSVDITKGWNGSPRAVIDEVIDQKTCDDLLEISSEYGVKGGTYPPEQQLKYGSPFSDAEYYSSVDLELLRRKGPAKAVIVEQIAANVKAIAKKYLDRENIDFELVDLQHREPIEGEVHENEFSLGLHADYCAIQEDGSCEPYTNYPDLAKRTAVAFLYLNEVEKGGDLVLTSRPKRKVVETIKPQCGRLVAMDAGEYRAIKAIKSGSRYELAIWFKDVPLKTEYAPVDLDPILPPPKLSTGYDKHVRLEQENLIGEEACERLTDIATRYGKVGGSFKKETLKKYGSVETNSEAFTDIHFYNLQQQKGVKKEELELVKSVSDLVLKQIEKHFNRRNLEIDYMGLPCRIAVEGETSEEGLSFALHGDNCHIQPDGSCIVPHWNPASFVRNTSALVYLTGDIEGGELFFTDRPNKEITKVVKPACGKLIAFDSGEFHGVKAITKGKRCALAVWFRKRKEIDSSL